MRFPLHLALRAAAAAALLLAILSPAPARADDSDWHLFTLDRREYVPLSDFCKFYGFTTAVTEGKVFTTHGAVGSLRLELESSKIYLNGVCHYLSFPITANEAGWLISRHDLTYLFEPILRPGKIPNRGPFHGVVIDAGHGGADNGALSTRDKMEKDYTLDTAFRLEKLMKARGLPVVLTRRTDEFVPLEERARFGERYRDFIFVSIHFNSAQQAARGLETYAETPRGSGSTSSEGDLRQSDFQKVPGNANDSLNALLGHEIHRQVITLNPGDTEADRGLKRARFVVLKENPIPAVLVEGGFLTNRIESAAIDQPAYRQKLAEAIATGIDGFLRATGNAASAVVAPPAIPAPAPAPVPVPPKAVPAAIPAPPPAPAPVPKAAAAEAKPTMAPAPAPTPTPTPPPDGPVIIYPTGVPTPPAAEPKKEEAAPADAAPAAQEKQP